MVVIEIVYDTRVMWFTTGALVLDNGINGPIRTCGLDMHDVKIFVIINVTVFCILTIYYCTR